MERLMTNHMNDTDALYAYALVSSRIGDIERAESLFERVLELKPENDTAAMSYVYLLKSNGNMTKALNWLEAVLKDRAESFNLRMTYARLLTDIKRFDEAREQFELLYNKKPDNADLIYALGLLSLQQNQSSEAEKYFENLLELKKYVFDANYYLGRIAEEKKQLDRANNFYFNVQGGDNYYDALIRVSLILTKQGKIEKALTNIRSIEKPKDANRNILIQAEAEILIEEERFEEALSVFNTAIEEQSHPDLLYSRAMLAEKIDRFDILESDLMSIIEKDPSNAAALNALGYTLADRGERLEDAYNYIKRAYELSPGDFYILDSMGWVLYRLGRLDEAIDFLRKAIDLRNDPEVAAHLGEVYWVMGNEKAAKNVWETALKDTPADDRLLKVIERFIP
jgi:tetratricopeptide (TPR) repeat protein